MVFCSLPVDFSLGILIQEGLSFFFFFFFLTGPLCVQRASPRVVAVRISCAGMVGGARLPFSGSRAVSRFSLSVLLCGSSPVCSPAALKFSHGRQWCANPP